MDRHIVEASLGMKVPPKKIYLIRHGESTHNAQTFATQGADVNDVRYIDAPLTARGEAQARSISEELSRLRPQLVVTSPLTRATQTALLACEGVSSPIAVSPLCSERLAYACDIGSTISTLRRRFSNVPYDSLRPVWWWSAADDTSPSVSSSLRLITNPHIRASNKIEPIHILRNRVTQFRVWLLRRPETVIAVFSHSVFNRNFLNNNTTMRNCEIRKVII